jgi:hypothetical protein
VQMRHRLAAVRTVIDDQPKTGIEDAFLFRHGLRDQEKMAQQRFIGCRGGTDSRDFFFWNDQDMDGRLRMNIVKGNAEVIFVGNLRRNFAGDDFRENRAHKNNQTWTQRRMIESLT